MQWRHGALLTIAAMALPLAAQGVGAPLVPPERLAQEQWRLEVLLSRARAQLDANKVSDALQSCLRAEDTGLFDARTQSLLGEVHVRRGEWGDAVMALRRATGSRRDKQMLAQAATELGWERRDTNGLEDAMGLWQEAVAADSMNAWAQGSLGLGYLAMGDLRQAEVHCRLGAELAGDWSGGRGNLALVLYVKRDYAAAEQAFRKVLELTPNDPAALSNLAFIKYDEGQIAEAVAMWERLVATGSASADQLAGLAIGYWSSGQKEKAVATYQEAVARDRAYLEPGELSTRRFWSDKAVQAATELVAATKRQ